MQNKVEIGIIGAMQIEIDGIKALMEDSVTINMSGIEFVKGKIYGKNVVTAVCGIGKVFSAVCAQTMILGFNPDVIINTGVAGTLTDELSIGDVAIAVGGSEAVHARARYHAETAASDVALGIVIVDGCIGAV